MCNPLCEVFSYHQSWLYRQFRAIRIALTLIATVCVSGFWFENPNASASTIFVAQSGGDDSRSRIDALDANSPVSTIQRGVDLALPGDYVYVKPGIYREFVRIHRSGTQANPIWLTGCSIGGSKIIGSVGGLGIRFFNMAYLEISNSNRNTGQNILEANDPKGVFFYFSHHIGIYSNRIHHCRGGGISIGQSDQITISGNVVNNCAAAVHTNNSGIGIYQPYQLRDATEPFGIIIERNLCFANRNSYYPGSELTDGHGILCDDFIRTQTSIQQYFGFYENQIEQNGAGQWDTIQSELDFDGQYTRKTLVESNLCYRNGGSGIVTYLSDNVEVRNNSCVHNQRNIFDAAELMVLDSRQVIVFNNLLISPIRTAGISEDGDLDQRVAGLAKSVTGRAMPPQRFAYSAILDTDSLQLQSDNLAPRNHPSGIYTAECVLLDRDTRIIHSPEGNLSVDTHAAIRDAGHLRPIFRPFDLNYKSRQQGSQIDIGANEADTGNPFDLSQYTFYARMDFYRHLYGPTVQIE